MRLLPSPAPRTPGELEARFNIALAECDLDEATCLFERGGRFHLTSDLVASGYDLRQALAQLMISFDGAITIGAADAVAGADHDQVVIRADWHAIPPSPRGITLFGTTQDVARRQADGTLLFAEQNLWAVWELLA